MDQYKCHSIIGFLYKNFPYVLYKRMYIIYTLYYSYSISTAAIIDEEEKPPQVSVCGYLPSCLKMPLEMEG